MYKAQHIVVVSEDAMVYDDLEELQYMPCFERILPQAAIVESVRSVYPTLTYPNHTSMRTGAYCYKHGIINNEKIRLNLRIGIPVPVPPGGGVHLAGNRCQKPGSSGSLPRHIV